MTEANRDSDTGRDQLTRNLDRERDSEFDRDGHRQHDETGSQKEIDRKR